LRRSSVHRRDLAQWSSSVDGSGIDLPASPDDDPRAVVLIEGPVNSGKSSLLRRLLHDRDEPLPSWLVVGGAPETFADNVTDGPVRFRDTPGYGTSSERHSEIAARDDVLDADVILVVLPAALLMSVPDPHVESLITGEAFHPNGCVPIPSTLIVINGRDAVGPNPETDRAGHEATAQRKVDELRVWLQAKAPWAVGVPVAAVSADPFEEIQNSPFEDGVDLYSEHRGWDGMASLAADLAAVLSERDSLRLARGARWRSRQLMAKREEGRAGRSQLDTNRLRHELELNRILGALRDLRRTERDLDARLAEAVDRVLGGLQALRGADAEQVSERIVTSLKLWLEESTDLVEESLATIERSFAELRGMAGRPETGPIDAPDLNVDFDDGWPKRLLEQSGELKTALSSLSEALRHWPKVPWGVPGDVVAAALDMAELLVRSKVDAKADEQLRALRADFVEKALALGRSSAQGVINPIRELETQLARLSETAGEQVKHIEEEIRVSAREEEIIEELLGSMPLRPRG
jgi:hypothetical protein